MKMSDKVNMVNKPFRTNRDNSFGIEHRWPISKVLCIIILYYQIQTTFNSRTQFGPEIWDRNRLGHVWNIIF